MNPESLVMLAQTLLGLLSVEGATVSFQTGHRTVVAVTVDEKDAERLVGKDGEHLRALNVIMRRLVEKQHGEKAASFLVDINGHHEQEAERVRSGARVLAQRVRLFKHDIEMDPMTPYERLVIHELFSEDPNIQTESAGEGKFRHIVLKYGKT